MLTVGVSRGAMLDQVRTIFHDASQLLKTLESSNYLREVCRAGYVCAGALRGGNKLLIFGNGGSASDAQHIAGELVGRFISNRRALPAISLSSDPAVLTCIANDFDYSQVFARQIEAHAVPGDVVWGISTSGNSENVVQGLRAARDRGIATVLMTGNGGGKAKAFADVLLNVPASETARIQEVHMISYHAICAAIESELFGDKQTEERELCTISAQ
jgi:D-sedoheptulose 7-phosphate isomerase